MTDEQWKLVEPFIPAGRPRKYTHREMLNALLYMAHTGCQWRALPHDFPPWTAVKWYFMLWSHHGILKKVHDALREQVRLKEGREPTPSVVIIDSQSVKTSVC